MIIPNKCEPLKPGPFVSLLIRTILPTVLTLLRFAAGLVFPFVGPFWRLPLVVFAAASDLADGWLSRRWNGGSRIGQLLDPIADKTFVLAVLATAWQEQWISAAELLWFASRDVTVLLLTLIAATTTRFTTRDLRPRWSGKIATAAQFVALVILVYRAGPAPLAVFWAGVVSCASAVDYIIAAVSAWRRRRVTS